MNKKTKKYERFSGKGRTGTRQLLLQVLYQHQMTKDDLETLLNQSLKIKEFSRIDQDYYQVLLSEVLENHNQIEEVISKYLDRPIEQIDPIEKAIMWIAVSEILCSSCVSSIKIWKLPFPNCNILSFITSS